MRKSWLLIIILVTLGFLAGAAGAGTVQISGKHGRGEIKGTCDSVGGTFTDGSTASFRASAVLPPIPEIAAVQTNGGLGYLFFVTC